MKLPEKLEVCPLCDGKGEYEQRYTVGCGMGTYKSIGPCDYCKHPEGHLYNGMKGLGYRMKDGSTVSLSVINQINVMNE